MDRPTNSNECTRCPGHGGLRVDGPFTLRLCQRCWMEWLGSAVRGSAFTVVQTFLDGRHEEAAPYNVREELTS